MTTLLVKNIHTLVTMDAHRREIRHGAILVRDNVIEQVGTIAELPSTADDVLDFRRSPRGPSRPSEYPPSLLPNPDSGDSSRAELFAV